MQDGYAALGHPDRTDLHVVNAHHDYNREQRELMYAWFGRWLGNDAPVAEAPFEPEDPAMLWCTASGQLLADGRGRSAPDLVRDLAARVVPAPAPLDTAAAAAAEGERVRAAAPPAWPGPALRRRPAAGAARDGARRSAGGAPRAPGADGRPPAGAAPAPPRDRRRGRPAPAIVLLDDRGKAAAGGPDGLAVHLARAGALTLSVDLRGWGETAWIERRFGWRQDRRAPLGADNMLSYVGYLTGTSSVAQRVQDALGALRYLRTRPDVDPARLYLAGRGGGAVVALHAAAAAGGADPGLSGVLLDAALATYRSAVDAERCRQPVADFLPGALLEYDLPDLAAALAPADVLVLDPQDAAGDPLPPATAAAAYDRASALAARLGGRLAVRCALPPAGRAAAVAAWIGAAHPAAAAGTGA